MGEPGPLCSQIVQLGTPRVHAPRRFWRFHVRRGGRESLVSLQIVSGKERRQMKLGRAVASVALGLVLASAARADLFWDANGTGTGVQ